jgi:hypothetical protein
MIRSIGRVVASLSGGLLVLGMSAWPASAKPVTVTVADTPPCDVLVALPSGIHELGTTSDFSPAERISSASTLPAGTPCPSTADSDPTTTNVLVTITNLTGVRWDEVHYVADPETTLTNVDGLINDERAFRIDTIGINAPLVSESGTPDGLFEPGETWMFIIQDYANSLFLPPSALGSVGVPSPGPLTAVSSGSIIALQRDPIGVPEPGTALAVGLGVAGLAAAMRRRRLRRPSDVGE